MSPSRSNAEPPADEHVLDEIAGELYALRPDGFIGARDDKAKRAREQGQAPLARAIAALRRPTQSAWLVNLLVRDQPDAVEELIELGDGLRKAHQNSDGAEEVRSGRLTKPVAYSGFGTLLAAVPSSPTGQRTDRRTTEESRRPTRAGTGAERSKSASRRSTAERESRADKE